MDNIMREIECGLKAKIQNLNYHKSELNLLRQLEKHIDYEISIINYKLTLFPSAMFERLVKIRAAELEKIRLDIDSELVLINYFQNDIDLHFFLKK